MRLHSSILFLWLLFSCSLCAMEEGEGGPENPSTWIVDLIAFREIGNSEYNSYFTNLINEIRARPSLEQLDLYLAMLEEAASHEAQNIVREICVLIKDYYYKLSEEKTLALASIHAIAKSLYAKISYPELDDLAKLDSPSKTTSNQGREKETEKEDPKACNFCMVSNEISFFVFWNVINNNSAIIIAADKIVSII